MKVVSNNSLIGISSKMVYKFGTTERLETIYDWWNAHINALNPKNNPDHALRPLRAAARPALQIPDPHVPPQHQRTSHEPPNSVRASSSRPYCEASAWAPETRTHRALHPHGARPGRDHHDHMLLPDSRRRPPRRPPRRSLGSVTTPRSPRGRSSPRPPRDLRPVAPSPPASVSSWARCPQQEAVPPRPPAPAPAPLLPAAGASER